MTNGSVSGLIVHNVGSIHTQALMEPVAQEQVIEPLPTMETESSRSLVGSALSITAAVMQVQVLPGSLSILWSYRYPDVEARWI